MKKKLKKDINNKSSLMRNFKIALSDLKPIKTYFWFSFFLFFFVAVIGLIFPIFFEDNILELIKDLIDKTEGLGFVGLTRFIIFNNVQSAFLGMVLGIFLAVFPISVIIVNAYVLGFVADKSIAVEGILVLWRLLPHGILEIPAILISVALGIKIGIELMTNCIFYYNKKINNLSLSLLILLSIIFLPISFIVYMVISLSDNKLRIKLIDNLIYSFRIFVFIVLPMLIVAGIIEGSLIWLLG